MATASAEGRAASIVMTWPLKKIRSGGAVVAVVDGCSRVVVGVLVANSPRGALEAAPPDVVDAGGLSGLRGLRGDHGPY